MQCQLYCTKRMYCDFIVWLSEDIHIERIYPDEEFMASCIEKAQYFFQNAVLPELIGKFYSRPDTVSTNLPSESSICESQQDTSTDEQVYCYCKGPESGKMIGCDNQSCPFQWFHFDCLNLKAPPRAKTWYCPDCRKLSSCRKTRK